MEAKRTVSLGATGRGEAHIGFGCSKVTFAAAPVATALVPTRIKSRRVQELCFMKKTSEGPPLENRCGRLSHTTVTIFFGLLFGQANPQILNREVRKEMPQSSPRVRLNFSLIFFARVLVAVKRCVLSA
jgi:hypothetical protein